MFMNSNI